MTNLEGLAKELFLEEVVKAAMAKVVTALPFLGLPVIGPIFSFFFNKVAVKFYDEMALHGAALVIDFKVGQQVEAYEKTEIELKEVIENNPTDEELRRAKDEYKKKLRDLIMLGV